MSSAQQLRGATQGLLDRSRRGAKEAAVDLAEIVASMAVQGRDGLNPEDIAKAERIEPFVHVGLGYRNMKSGTDFVSGNLLKFSLTRNEDFTFVAGDKQPDNIIIVTHVGIEVNRDVQSDTLEQISELGIARFVGPGKFLDIVRPLRDYLLPAMDMPNGAATTVAATTIGEDGFRIPGNRDPKLLPVALPILENETATLNIEGLSGLILGATPILKLRPIMWGFLVRKR